MITLQQLFDNFVLEKTYVQNCSPKTIIYFKQSFRTYKKVFPDLPMPTKETLLRLVVNLRENGMTAGCCNSYFKGLNSFLDWLFENKYLTEKLKLKLLKREKLVMRSFNDVELRKLIAFKPDDKIESRLHTIICLLIDTGIRIDEALTLHRNKVDFENLVITVYGKGSKERVIPISIEMRRLLFKHMKTHSFDLVFCTKDGRKLNYQNTYRDYLVICDKVKVEPEGFHAFRRTFARNYLKAGGNLLYLQAALGHERLETTRTYVEVEMEDLKVTHLKTSILARLR